jgi:hypothetical protein
MAEIGCTKFRILRTVRYNFSPLSTYRHWGYYLFPLESGFSVHFTGHFKNEKKEKERKERGLVSNCHPLNSLPQVVAAFAKKNLPRAKARGNHRFKGAT